MCAIGTVFKKRMSENEPTVPLNLSATDQSHLVRMYDN